jgi:hypothetical protein
MAEVFEDDVLQEEQIESQEESTAPWTVMLVIALVLQVVVIVLAWMELDQFYRG